MSRAASPVQRGALAAGLRLPLPADRAAGDLFASTRRELVTVWGGFSTRWYAALLATSALDRPVSRSACGGDVSRRPVATLLGTLAAIALVRFGRFRGRTLFAGMIYAPLVMPEVIHRSVAAAAVCRPGH